MTHQPATHAIRRLLTTRATDETSRDRDVLAVALSDAALEAAGHQEAIDRAAEAERALGDLLGRLHRIPAEYRALVLGDSREAGPVV